LFADGEHRYGRREKHRVAAGAGEVIDAGVGLADILFKGQRHIAVVFHDLGALGFGRRP
jgi:hypothetical protein